MFHFCLLNISVKMCNIALCYLPVLRSWSAQEALAAIGEKLTVELSQCLSQHGYSPSADQKSTLRGQISAIIQPDNTVRKLMGNVYKYNDYHSTANKELLTVVHTDLTMISSCLLSDSRVHSYLLASLDCFQRETPPPLPGGLLPVSRELKELAVRFSHLVNFNKLVFSPFYENILRKKLTGGESL